MMEKLLHERLREWAKDAAPIYAAKNYYDCFDSLFESLADEIERYYIPRPRFEDVEPVQFGDATDELYHVDTISFYEDGGISLNSVDSEVFLGVGELVKRPTPKVCDADGVEIKRGDEVWRIHSKLAAEAGSLIVESICDKGVYTDLRVDGKAILFDPLQLTHERPVFDAEGVRICKGDTVWHVGDASRGTVVGIIMDNTWHGYPVKVAWDKGDEGFYQGNALTHREPDSLESIAKYAKNEAVKYAGCIEPLNNIADRLAAIVERGA